VGRRKEIINLDPAIKWFLEEFKKNPLIISLLALILVAILKIAEFFNTLSHHQ